MMLGLLLLVSVLPLHAAVPPPVLINAILLPSDVAGQMRLAVDWNGAAGARLDVGAERSDRSRSPLVSDQVLDRGVNLLSLPLDGSHASDLRFTVRDATGQVCASTRKSVDALRDASSFAWQLRFTGPGLDGNALSAVIWDDGSGPALYVGGLFNSAGNRIVNHVARWDGQQWSPLTGPSGTGVSGTVEGSGANVIVSALAVYDGALIVAGSFESAGGVAVNSIARWDGHAWSSLGGGFTPGAGAVGAVFGLTVYDGALIAVGDFYGLAGSTQVNGVARWDGSAWSALGVGVDSGTAFCATVYGGDLVVGGNFLMIGGAPANRVARWDGSAWSTLGSGVDGAGVTTTVYALTVDNGALYAGGLFPVAGGATVNNVARWDGSAWSALGSGTNGTVYALDAFGGAVVAGGDFTSASGQSVNRVARWNGTAWSTLPGPSGTGVNGVVRTLAANDDALYAGGVFTAAGGVSTNRIARWNGAAWSALSSASDAGLNGQVLRATIYDGALIVGGTFTQAGATTVNGVARWDGEAWSALSGPSGTGVSGGLNVVNALAVHDGALYVGGSFSSAGGVAATDLARWDGSAWSAVTGPGGGGVSDRVWTLVEYDGALIAGGAFLKADGITVNRVARWDGSAWSALAGAAGAGVDNTVYSLGVYDGALIVGGTFVTAGGVTVNDIARWDGSAWSALTGAAGTGVDNRVQALAVYDGALIVGGSFTHAGGLAANAIARWNGGDWSNVGAADALGGGCCAPAVRALAVYDDALYAGGTFAQADGATVNEIARWDGSAWSALSGPAGTGVAGSATGSGSSGSVETLVPLDDGTLAVGGNFSSTGGVPNWGVGLYGPVAFSIAPSTLDFGSIEVGTSAGPQSVTLSNSGADDVTVSAVSGVAAPFASAAGSCGDAPFTVAAGSSCTLAFTYHPTAPGTATATVSIASSASSEPGTLTLTGTATAAPTIDVAPASLAATLHAGETATRTLSIGNVGVGTLDWSIAQGVATDLSESTSTEIQSGNSTACQPPSFGQPPFPTSANSFYRVFTPSDYGVSAGFTVGAVTFGIEKLTKTTDLTVNLYTLDGALASANLTLIGSATQSFDAQALQLVTVPVTATVPAGATLVVEVAAPAMSGHDQFLPGSNALGQSAPSYVNSFGQCGVNDITDLATLGQPDMHLVISVSGTDAACELPSWVGVAPGQGSVDGGQTQDASVAFDAGGLATGDYSANLCVASNDPVHPLVRVPLSMSVVDTYVVTPSAGPHGAIAPSTPQSVDQGATATFTLTPDTGYHVDAVGGTCGGELVGDVYTTAPVAADCTVEATFAIDAPTTIAVVSGTPQTATVTAAFAEPLRLHVANDAGLGVPGVTVSFAAPAAGASATLPATATTDDAGDVSVVASAGSVAGAYVVHAGVAGVDGSADFALTNAPGPAARLVRIGGDAQTTAVGTPFPLPLAVQVTDAWNNPVAQAAVVFAAPASGPSATLSATSATTDANGSASVRATANAQAGSYAVAASVAGVDAPASFALTNAAAQVALSIRIDDGRDTARYGQMLDYVITVHNAGADAAHGIAVDVPLPPQLDAAFAAWICVDAASGDCSASGSGALSDSGVTLPANGNVTYLLSVPVRLDAAGGSVDVVANANLQDASAPASATDSDALVLFSDGFDAYVGALPSQTSGAPFRLDAPWPFALPDAPGTQPVDTLLAARDDGHDGFRVERLNVLPVRLRLVAVAAGTVERATAWTAVSDPRALALVGDAATRSVRLRGVAAETRIGLAPDVSVYEVREWQAGE